MAKVFAKRFGDLGPVLLRTVTRADGTPQVLPVGTTAVFRFVREDTEEASTLDAEVLTPGAESGADVGVVRHVWASGFAPLADGSNPTETIAFRMTVEATLPDGLRITSPTRGFDYFLLRPRGP
jgi:hypothetical protein